MYSSGEGRIKSPLEDDVIGVCLNVAKNAYLKVKLIDIGPYVIVYITNVEI